MPFVSRIDLNQIFLTSDQYSLTNKTYLSHVKLEVAFYPRNQKWSFIHADKRFVAIKIFPCSIDHTIRFSPLHIRISCSFLFTLLILSLYLLKFSILWSQSTTGIDPQRTFILHYPNNLLQHRFENSVFLAPKVNLNIRFESSDPTPFDLLQFQ